MHGAHRISLTVISTLCSRLHPTPRVAFVARCIAITYLIYVRNITQKYKIYMRTNSFVAAALLCFVPPAAAATASITIKIHTPSAHHTHIHFSNIKLAHFNTLAGALCVQVQAIRRRCRNIVD